LLEPVVLCVVVVVVCMAGGWFFFQGPGRAAINDLFAGGTKESATPNHAATVVAQVTPAAPPAPIPLQLAPQLGSEDRKTAVNANTVADNRAPTPANNIPNPSPSRPAMPEPMPQLMPAPKPVTPAPMPAPRPAVTFEKHILPIFEAKCLSCHGANKKRGGLDMRTVAAMLRGSDSGPSLVPGSPERSLLYETIVTKKMPPTPNKLSQSESKLVQEWIAGGAR